MILRWLLLPALVVSVSAADFREAGFGARLPCPDDRAVVWTASSGWKVGRTRAPPEAAAAEACLSAARSETEAVQLIVTPRAALANFSARPGPLAREGGGVLPSGCVEVLRVAYVDVATPTDGSTRPGAWPDPLPPLRAGLTLPAGTNQPLWVRVHVPADAAPGRYRGTVRLSADGWSAEAPLAVEVFGFTLPDRMRCSSAFGFSPHNVFRYHGLKTDADRRAVLAKYFDSFQAHRIAPYDPAPMDPFQIAWPDVKPPPPPWADWADARIVTNEAHGGRGSLLIFDDRRDATASVAYRPPIAIPTNGLRLRFHYRTAVPDHAFIVTFNHHDAAGKWMSGRNNDMTLRGNGTWQSFDRTIRSFPAGAATLTLTLRATEWREDGSLTGLVWFDDLTLQDAATGADLVKGGDFEPATARPPVAPPEKLQARVDFSAWDAAMSDAIDRRKFNTFRLHFPGLGGETYEGFGRRELLGFSEDDPEYPVLLESFGRALRTHLAAKGWLDEAFVYWFDEPEPSQYEYVRRGFEWLRKAAPGVRGMLTEQVEPALVGGPQIWCPVSPNYDAASADARRKAGETFWWYVCCGPKAPYATLFLDHPGTELRVWLWQTWQRGIEGILVWETTYWTSGAAYPDREHPQNPWTDPMGWVSSGTPGQRRPWGNGDGRFLYPPEAAADARPAAPVLDGPVDSIRWEMLRDGVEDYEYLGLLKDRLAAAGTALTSERRKEYEALLAVPPTITTDLTHFTTDPAPIEERRTAVARAIEALAAPR